MAKAPALFSELVQCLKYLPGVGPRSAERLAYHLLQSKPRSAHLVQVLGEALTQLMPCEQCNHYTQTPVCHRCADPKRDKRLICVIEQPHDLRAIEQSGGYQGSFYVLMGRISPLDGIGPDELKLTKLVKRIEDERVEEVIFALSPTVEGQTTLHCIQSLLPNRPIKLSQLAQGVPLGSELSALDELTIASAIQNRAALPPSF